MSHAPSAALSRRHHTIRREMDARGLDALVVTSLPNILYLTNFTGTSAIVVLTRDRPVGREELIGALWPGHAPRSQDAAMRTLLSRLRSALGPGNYQLTIEGLSWRGDPEPDSWVTIGIQR